MSGNDRSKADDTSRMTPGLRWTAHDLARLSHAKCNYADRLTPPEAQPRADGFDVWDSWPLADADGGPVPWYGGELWFALAVPRSDDPEQRHGIARIHHFHRRGDRFMHLGETLPDGFTPGSREWSGSALAENGTVTLYFTATGYRGQAAPTFHQRIFAATASIGSKQHAPFGRWSPPHELVQADGVLYRPADQEHGEPGKIKGFRDPAHFRDHDGTNYLLFTGSSAQGPDEYDGVIGLARSGGGGIYSLLPALIDASGASNELERPHIVRSGGRLYLFWSVQSGVFAPEIDAPTGLYGAVASSLSGPWELLNGHGLVLANPPDNPAQTYSWWVLPDLSVASFVDHWQASGAGTEQFGGTFAPFVHITLDGATASLVGENK